jgi:hypothetical protein
MNTMDRVERFRALMDFQPVDRLPRWEWPCGGSQPSPIENHPPRTKLVKGTLDGTGDLGKGTSDSLKKATKGVGDLFKK